MTQANISIIKKINGAIAAKTIMQIIVVADITKKPIPGLSPAKTFITL
jgi:hypothetical protein|tara:strand:+ start:94 stop:237 length:144 start_codon:yes stop_codon:yes gene_type:complete